MMTGLSLRVLQRKICSKNDWKSWRVLVNLLKDGPWSTKSVFTVRYMCDIDSVDGVLGSDSTLYW